MPTILNSFKKRIIDNYDRFIKNEYNRITGNIWKFTTFADCENAIDSVFELYPEKTIQYTHKDATPALIHHFRQSKNILLLDDIIFWPHTGVIQIDDNAIIRDSAFCEVYLERYIEKNRLRKFPVIHESSPCTSIEHGPLHNYYHWYIDSLPRLYGLHHPEIAKIPRIKLFITRELTDVEAKIVEELIPENTIIEKVPRNRRIRTKRYIHLPGLSQFAKGYLPEDYISFFRNKMFSLFDIRENDASNIRRIYISRKKAQYRRIINDNELAKGLRKFGFEPLCLEDFTLKEQIEIFRSAGIVAGMHGAGFTNIIYSNNAKIIELFPSNFPGINHYRMLASSCGHDYANIYFGKQYRKDELESPEYVRYTLKIHNTDVEADIDRVVDKFYEMNTSAVQSFGSKKSIGI